MNKTDELILGEKSSPNVQEEVALFNRYFKSVYFLNSPAKSKVLNPKHEDEPTLTKIFISKKSVSMILQNAATTKARATEGIPHVFFRKLAKPSSHALHLNSKARSSEQRRYQMCGTVFLFYTFTRKKIIILSENYRPVTRLYFLSKALERCMSKPLNELFVNHLTNSHNGLIRRKVCTNKHSALSPF